MTEPTRAGPSELQLRWHAITPEEALVRLDSGPQGLASSEATRRSTKYGPNRLPAARPRRAFARFLSQFNNVLIYVLLASAVIALFLGHLVDTMVILLVVMANAAVGFVQEGRAQRALDAVRKMVTPRASVLRDGHRTAIAAEQLVPGDLVVLESGDRVPADLRLLRAHGLRVEEAILTGESIAVEKSPDAVAADADLGDRSSVAFSGTFVAAGQGSGVVVATGAETELGKISALLETVEKLETPLLRQMNRFARQLTFVILGTSLLVLAFALLVRGHSAAEGFMAVVGLAVAAIPEGLPAVLTITLALGVQRMAARNAIVRRLPAVETLGSVSIICSDKTGTLTRNAMSVRSVVTASHQYEVTGAGYEPRGAFRLEGHDIDAAGHPMLLEAARTALLCNDASLRQTSDGWRVEGDPMEGALISLAVKTGYDPELVRKQFPRRDEIPFDARHRFMATLHHAHDDGTFVCVKGAPEQLLGMCTLQLGERAEAPLDPGHWLRSIETLAGQGMRVLGLATGRVTDGKQDLTTTDVQRGLTLIGLVGLIDPPREEAIEAVRQCRAAGIGVKMITGDHAVTAAAVAAELRLADEIVVTTGRELDALDEAGFARAAGDSTVLARASPEHKLRLVEALQADGSVVAMTGDGVNDAPALRRADIGVAMGSKGTEVAKESAEMVLADDNFATIVAAVREGRRVYDNLRKVVEWTLPTGGGEASTIIAAILAGATLPVTPVQILWINLITAVALGLTLAFEPADPAIMQRPPRRADDALLSGGLIWRTTLVSALFATAAFAMFERARAVGVSLEGARTIVVNTIVGMEIFYLYRVRYAHSRRRGWRAVLGTPAVLIGVAGVVVGQIAFTYLPLMQSAFHTRGVSALDWLEITLAGFALLGALAIADRAQGVLSRIVDRKGIDVEHQRGSRSR